MIRTLSLSVVTAALSLLVVAQLGGCGADSGSTGRGGGAEGAGGGGGEGAAEPGNDGEGGGGGNEGGAVAGHGEGNAQGNEGGGAGGDVGGNPDPDPVIGGEQPDLDDVDTSWGETMVLNTLTIGGEGFDLDGDGRADNALGAAGLIANGQIKTSIEAADLLLGLDLRVTDDNVATGFLINMYSLEDGDEDPADNFSGAEELTIDIRSFKEDGMPLIRFPGATITAGLLAAETDAFVLAFPVGEEGAEKMFQVTLHAVKMEATVDGEYAGLIEGKIGGAVRDDEIRTAIKSFDLPDGMEETIEAFLSSPDFDTDGDGLNDAFTIALTFTATTCTFKEGFANVEPKE